MPARKRKQPDEKEESAEHAETSRSVLGVLVPFKNSKSIPCERRGKKDKSRPSLIFTHGAGGGISNPATVGFAEGYATAGEVLCFQGTMNLKSRVDSFIVVLQYETAQAKQKQIFNFAVGGRSMGARAAVMTAVSNPNDNVEIDKLVLVSYPLRGANGELRDQILLDLDDSKQVLFVTGSQDHMCSVDELNKVRSKMKAQTWLVTVEGADHGMSLKVKKKGQAGEAVRKKSGELAATWVTTGKLPHSKQASIAWVDDKQEVVVLEHQSKAGKEKAGSKQPVDNEPEHADSTAKRKRHKR